MPLYFIHLFWHYMLAATLAGQRRESRHAKQEQA
jgi:hypothetical protein